MTKKQRNTNKRSSFCCFAAFQFEKVRYDQDMLTCCQANVAGHRDSWESCLSAQKLSSAFGNLTVRPGFTGSYGVEETWGGFVYILRHEVPPPFLIGGFK